jgi:dihydroorotate dehydrogenase (NAD+) catalytic subunit
MVRSDRITALHATAAGSVGAMAWPTILRRHAEAAPLWDHPVMVGRTQLRNPVMAASGTFGFGLEYAAHGDLAALGCFVTKSLSATPWAGNPAPRLVPLDPPGTMLNSVGLPNPGVAAWAADTLPALLARGVHVVASIWGHTPDELLDAARAMRAVEGPVAWELNLSCPNLATSDAMPSHNPDVAGDIVSAVRAMVDPSVGLWAKLSPHAERIVEVAARCQAAGIDSVTMTNTYPGANFGLPAETRALGKGTGGVSGAALKPIVMPLVQRVRAECPDLPIVAAGGVQSVDDALDYLRIGATAVQIGTANFFDPRITFRIAAGVVAALSEAPG